MKHISTILQIPILLLLGMFIGYLKYSPNQPNYIYISDNQLLLTKGDTLRYTIKDGNILIYKYFRNNNQKIFIIN